MALRLDSFGLGDLAARPEDAFRLANLALAEGARLPGYGGDYYRLRIGDAQLLVRMGRDRESGQEALWGMDTHAASSCVWTARVVRDLTAPASDAMSRRVLVGREDTASQAVVELLCCDALPSIGEGDTLRLNMAGFPLRISYDAGESSGAMEAGEDTTLLQGLVKDAKVGETYLGMEPLTKFVSVTASTAMGDVELCHPLDMVAESQRDMVRPGAVVSALCVLSGDCAIGEYAGGLVFGQEQNFRLLADFLRRGGTERLRPILRAVSGKPPGGRGERPVPAGAGGPGPGGGGTGLPSPRRAHRSRTAGQALPAGGGGRGAVCPPLPHGYGQPGPGAGAGDRQGPGLGV